jgi:hypothetical protein
MNVTESQNTSWIVAEDEVLLPTSDFGARLGFTKPESTDLDRRIWIGKPGSKFQFCEWKTSPAFRNQVPGEVRSRRLRERIQP